MALTSIQSVRDHLSTSTRSQCQLRCKGLLLVTHCRVFFTESSVEELVELGEQAAASSMVCVAIPGFWRQLGAFSDSRVGGSSVWWRSEVMCQISCNVEKLSLLASARLPKPLPVDMPIVTRIKKLSLHGPLGRKDLGWDEIHAFSSRCIADASARFLDVDADEQASLETLSELLWSATW